MNKYTFVQNSSDERHWIVVTLLAAGFQAEESGIWLFTNANLAQIEAYCGKNKVIAV